MRASAAQDRKKITGCLERSCCPVTNTLDLIGDKWTLLIIRDMMFLRKKSFKELLQSLEGIATNILTDRLRRLEKCGIIEKNPYRLTKRGKDLKPVLTEMARWGSKHIKGAKGR